MAGAEASFVRVCQSALMGAGLVALIGAALLAPGRVAAQDATAHPLDSALKMLNLKTDPGPMPDFVKQSRDADAKQDFISVGAKPPDRSVKMKTPAEVQALTAELDAARAAQLAGQRPKPPSTPAKAKAKPAHPKAILPKTATNR